MAANADLQSIADKLDEVHEVVVALKTQNTIYFGNGQPGRFQEVEKDVKKQAAQLNRWKGALWLLAFLLTLVGGGELWHIMTTPTQAQPVHRTP